MQYVSRHVFVVCMLLSVVVGAVSGGAVTLIAPYLTQRPSVSVDSSLSAPELLIAGGEGQQIVAVVKRTSPSVVAIDVRKQVSNSRSFRRPLSDGLFDEDAASTTQQRIGGGSGFFVSNDGLVVTNRHVVEDKTATYSITTQDGLSYPATVLDTDSVLDLAILKVAVSSTIPLELGDSDAVDVGETVIAIGNALAEFQNTVTKGIVSGKNRRLIAGGVGGDELIEEAIQTDAAINLGNSGGPLLDLRGKVIGVNTAVSEGGRSLGFAIPANAVKRAIESVKKTGRIIRPWLGVRYFMINADMAKRENLPVNYGALVSRGASPRDLAIVSGSPADRAGIKENDIILEVQGQRLSDAQSLSTILSRFAPGDQVSVKVLRQKEEKMLTLNLDERTPENR